MTEETPKLPGILTQGKNFAIAYTKWSYHKWVKARKPKRSAKEVEALFDFCAGCPEKQFIRVDDVTGRCAECGCWLKRTIGTGPNKLEWPTEGCPYEHWNAQVEEKPED